MTVRLAKIVMALSLAAFALLVTYGNLVDYGSNFAFVRHVMAMDTTFPDNALMSRAITEPVLWRAGYALIIAVEGTTGILLVVGAVALWRARYASAMAFHAAKRWVVAGCLLGFLLWFLGFMAIGGEWFGMWQSKVWNGQEAAFRFYMALLGVLVFVNQPDTDLT